MSAHWLVNSLNHARSGSDRVTASTAPLMSSTSPLPGVPHCALALSDFHEVSRAVGPKWTGSKIAFLMPEYLQVRLGSQAFAVSGSFAKCGLVWPFHTGWGRVPHSEPGCAKLSRSTDRGDAQSLRWFCCVLGVAPND